MLAKTFACWVQHPIYIFLAFLFFFTYPARSDVRCGGLPPQPFAPPRPNPNCARAIQDLLDAGSPFTPPRFDDLIHWVSNPANVTDTAILGQFNFRHAEPPYRPCHAVMYAEPLLYREDWFSWKEIGDVVQDIWTQCTVWGATLGVGTVGPGRFWTVEIFREDVSEEERHRVEEEARNAKEEHLKTLEGPTLRILPEGWGISQVADDNLIVS